MQTQDSLHDDFFKRVIRFILIPLPIQPRPNHITKDSLLSVCFQHTIISKRTRRKLNCFDTFFSNLGMRSLQLR